MSDPSVGSLDPQLISVCQYDNCLRNRSAEVLKALQSLEAPPEVTIEAGGCQGQCHLGANVQITREERSGELLRSVWYCGVKPEDSAILLEQHCRQAKLVTRLLNPRMHPSA